MYTFDNHFQFFKLDVIYECPDGTLAVAPPSHVMSEIHKVLDSAPETCEHPVGVLTTDHRDNWIRTREEMMQGLYVCYC